VGGVGGGFEKKLVLIEERYSNGEGVEKKKGRESWKKTLCGGKSRNSRDSIAEHPIGREERRCKEGGRLKSFDAQWGGSKWGGVRYCERK